MATITKLLAIAIIALGLVGCDRFTGPSEKQRTESQQPDVTKQPAAVLQAVYGPKDLNAWYWQGVRDQAWAQHKGRPIYHVAVIDGRDVLYAPIEAGPIPEEVKYAIGQKEAQEALDAADKPLKKR